VSRRTGFWFQMARGRAMVRKNAMRKARRLKEMLDRGDFSEVPGSIWRKEEKIAWLRFDISMQVSRARAANCQWRNYRRHHLGEIAAEEAL
jgi:hypothetical protein